MSKITLIFKGKLRTADHDGYCSGNECEDKKTVNMYSLVISVGNEVYNTLKNMDYNSLFNKYKKYVKKKLSKLTGSLCGGSGYCGSSPSGRKHEFCLSLKLIKIDFTDYSFETKNLTYLHFYDQIDWIESDLQTMFLEEYLKKLEDSS